MSVTPIQSARRWAIPESAIEALATLGGFSIDDIGQPSRYELRRRRIGAEIWVYYPDARLSVNISIHRDIWPANFKEARSWMKRNFPLLPENGFNPSEPS
jgi:hypothetical protein